MKTAKNILKRIAKKFGYEFLSTEILQNIRKEETEATFAFNRLAFIIQHTAINKDVELGNFFQVNPRKIKQSMAQLFQDIFVLHVLKEKHEGFFVEFGATDGKSLSNTWMLEKHYGWKGILAEPAMIWHPHLFENRTCNIDKRCVWETSGLELPFLETIHPELSTLSNFSRSDYHAARRENNKGYFVKTISLEDLLIEYNAPSQIDYLSIDTEGSEFSILKDFDFSRYSFQIITVEHNHSTQREYIHKLLVNHGYRRVLEQFSFFDDWYIHNSVKEQLT